MRPQFTLRVRPGVGSFIQKPRNQAEASVKMELTKERNEQIEQAVEWCRNNNKRGWAALSTGTFPLIKSKNVINNRLDGKVITGNEKKHLKLLTSEEEVAICDYLKLKNQAHQGMNRKRTTQLILDVLKIRKHANKKMKGGRKYVALTRNGKTALANSRCAIIFFKSLSRFSRPLFYITVFVVPLSTVSKKK